MPVCWYCSRNEAEPGCAFERPLHRVAKMNAAEVTYELKRIPIARCGACRDAHQRVSSAISLAAIGALLVGGGVFGGLSFVTTTANAFFAGLVVMLVVWVVLVRGASSKLARQGTRHEFEVSAHPEVAAAVKEGWIEGERA